MIHRVSNLQRAETIGNTTQPFLFTAIFSFMSDFNGIAYLLENGLLKYILFSAAGFFDVLRFLFKGLHLFFITKNKNAEKIADFGLEGVKVGLIVPAILFALMPAFAAITFGPYFFTAALGLDALYRLGLAFRSIIKLYQYSKLANKYQFKYEKPNAALEHMKNIYKSKLYNALFGFTVSTILTATIVSIFVLHIAFPPIGIATAVGLFALGIYNAVTWVRKERAVLRKNKLENLLPKVIHKNEIKDVPDQTVQQNNSFQDNQTLADAFNELHLNEKEIAKKVKNDYSFSFQHAKIVDEYLKGIRKTDKQNDDALQQEQSTNRSPEEVRAIKYLSKNIQTQIDKLDKKIKTQHDSRLKSFIENKQRKKRLAKKEFLTELKKEVEKESPVIHTFSENTAPKKIIDKRVNDLLNHNSRHKEIKGKTFKDLVGQSFFKEMSRTKDLYTGCMLLFEYQVQNKYRQLYSS